VSVCSICSRPEVRATVEGALLSGSRPIDVWRHHGELFTPPLSLSSVYRHCKSHVHSGLNRPWASADTTTGELLTELSALRRGLMAQYDAAAERGDSAASTRAAHEAHAIASTLLRNDIEDDEDVDAKVYAQHLADAIELAMRDRHGFAIELADAARTLGYDDVVDDMRVVVDYLEISSTKKEN
jgi:hypothetical protein